MTVEKQTWKILSKNFLFIPINTLQLFVHQPINFLGLRMNYRDLSGLNQQKYSSMAFWILHV